MNWLLDTNVISQQAIDRPKESAMHFLTALPQKQAYLSVISLMEVRDGIERLKEQTQRRERLEVWLTKRLPNLFAGRILPVTAEVANIAGQMLAAERKAKRTPDTADALLAATAKQFGMGVATLNRKHFETLGVELVEF